MVSGVEKLVGRNNSGVPYSVCITVNDGNVEGIIISGKPGKPIQDVVENFKNKRGQNFYNVEDSIKLIMAKYNEYVTYERA